MPKQTDLWRVAPQIVDAGFMDDVLTFSPLLPWTKWMCFNECSLFRVSIPHAYVTCMKITLYNLQLQSEKIQTMTDFDMKICDIFNVTQHA